MYKMWFRKHDGIELALILGPRENVARMAEWRGAESPGEPVEFDRFSAALTEGERRGVRIWKVCDPGGVGCFDTMDVKGIVDK